jgi:hypothetical protein
MAGIGVLLLSVGSRADVSEPARAIELNITAPTLATALLQFSQQTGLQLLFPTDGDATRLHAPIVQGSYTPSEGLEVLLRNSGFTFRFVNARTVSVSWAQTVKTDRREKNRSAQP